MTRQSRANNPDGSPHLDTRNGLEVPPSSTDTHLWDTDKIPVQEDIIRSFLSSYSRDPFQRQLAKLIGASPDRQSLKAFANRNPDRWARCVQIFASLSGYTEKIEVEHNFNIDSMSDAEVERRLAEIERLLQGTETINQPSEGADQERRFLPLDPQP